MKHALVNSNWRFGGNVRFGCHEPRLPVEYGYAQYLGEDEADDEEVQHWRSEVQDQRPVPLAELRLSVDRSWPTPAQS